MGLDGKLMGTGRLEHALATVMARFGLLDGLTCVARVRAGGAERDALIEQVVVPETWFFRDRGPFDFLRRVAAEQWVGRQSDVRLRVLSLACATGEEPYSIAVTLAEAGLAPARFGVDAVDISVRAIEKARRAVFGPYSFRERLDPREERYFSARAEGRAVDARIAARVRFMRGNVVGEMPALEPGGYHAVFCRNLMIYLSDAARDRVLAWVGRQLLPDGFLFVGHSELPLANQAGFVPVKHARAFVCRRGKTAEREARRPARSAFRSALQRARRTASAPSVLAPEPADAAIDTVPSAAGSRGTRTTVERVRSLADAGSTAEAYRLCEAHLCQHRTDVEAHYLMGVLHQTANRDTDAEESFRRALYLDPRHYESLVHLSLQQQEHGNAGQAERLRERARRVFDERGGTVRLAAG